MSSTLTDLNHFDLIAVEGKDAAKFLQGQLTCNLDHASHEHSILGAYCNLTGRAIADMRLLPYDGGIFLLCAQGVGASLQQTLDKYIVFSKAKTRDATNEFKRFGLQGAQAASTLESLFARLPHGDGDIVTLEQSVAYRVSDTHERFEILVHTAHASLLTQVEALGVSPELVAWDLAQISQGIVNITVDRQDRFTPQVLNYDLRGLIDFKKGCYTGQEIIARMHYRGKAKRRLFLGQVDAFAFDAHSALKIENKPVGEIISFAKDRNGGGKFLAILPCELVEQGAHIELYNDATGTVQHINGLTLAGETQ